MHFKLLLISSGFDMIEHSSVSQNTKASEYVCLPISKNGGAVLAIDIFCYLENWGTNPQKNIYDL